MDTSDIIIRSTSVCSN